MKAKPVRLKSEDHAFIFAYQAALKDAAKLHKMAVDAAREYSGFTDEQAIHAFAFTVRSDALNTIGNPNTVIVHDTATPATKLALLYAYAEFEGITTPDLFIKCLMQITDGFKSEEDARKYMHEIEMTKSRFDSCNDYVALADLVILLHDAVNGVVDIDDEEVSKTHDSLLKRAFD